MLNSNMITYLDESLGDTIMENWKEFELKEKR